MSAARVRYLTTAEAAAILGVSVRRVQAMVKAETLPARKFGRDLQILEADVRRALAEREGWQQEGWTSGRPKGISRTP